MIKFTPKKGHLHTMGLSATASIFEPYQPQLVELHLESLRRDAFVMEAFNYETPAIATTDDFTKAFELLYRQMRALFGSDTVLIAAIDAQYSETHHGARQVLTGIGCPQRERPKVWGPRKVSDSERLARLGEFSSSVDGVLSFCMGVESEFGQFLTKHSKVSASVALLAPYLVRKIAQPLAGKKYRDLIDIWDRTKAEADLLFTRAFANPVPDKVKAFANSYFAAVLLVYVPSQSSIKPVDIVWLEALHLSFQISWGIPALQEHRRELEQLRRFQNDVRKQSESFRQLQVLAHTISDKIHEQSNQLIRELDPGTGIEREDLAYLFMNSSHKIWTGKEIGIHGLHDYVEEPRTAQAIIYYVMHRIFDILPDEGLTLHQLRQSAERLTESPEAQSSPILSALLRCIFKADEYGFNLTKSIIYRMHTVNAELPFYSLAARLFLGPVDDEFLVDIFPAGISGACTRLKRSTFLDIDVIKDILEKPYFPQTAVRPKEWALPLVNLIAIQLRGLTASKDVSIPSVSIIRDMRRYKIVCPLQGSSSGLKDVKDILNDTPTKEWSVRGFRGALWQLHMVRTNLSRSLVWKVDDSANFLTFEIV